MYEAEGRAKSISVAVYQDVLYTLVHLYSTAQMFTAPSSCGKCHKKS